MGEKTKKTVIEKSTEQAIREGSSVSFVRMAKAQHKIQLKAMPICHFLVPCRFSSAFTLSLSNFHSKQHEFRHRLHKRPLACSHGKSTSLPIQVLFVSSPLPACAHGARQDGMEKTQRKRVGKKRKKYTVFFLRYAGETRAGVLKHIFPFSPCCFLVDRRRS